MKCSPKYKQNDRQETQSTCNENCWHWKECLKELKLKNYKFKHWIEHPATPAQIKSGNFHIKDGKKLHWHIKQHT